MTLNNGFSILELLITILLIAILFSLGSSTFGHIKLRNELALSTKQLYYFLEQVQTHAYTHNINYSVYFINSPFCLVATQKEKPTKCQGDYLFYFPYASTTLSRFAENPTTIFWGKRNMAKTATFELQNKIGTTYIIISFRGRTRICAKDVKLFGMPSC